MEGRFFLDTQKGLDTFRTVKAMSEEDSLQEWSYSLDNIKARRGDFEGKQVRFIESVDVTEPRRVERALRERDGDPSGQRGVHLAAQFAPELLGADAGIDLLADEIGREAGGVGIGALELAQSRLLHVIEVFVERCPDFVTAPTLPELAERIREAAPDDSVARRIVNRVVLTPERNRDRATGTPR